MSRARFDPFKGQFGWWGSGGSGEETRLRHWLIDQPGGAADPVAPSGGGVPMSRAGHEIEGLGHKKYWSKGDKKIRWNIFTPFGKYSATPDKFRQHYYNPQVEQLTKEPLSEMAKVREQGEEREGETAFTRVQEGDLPQGFREEFGDIPAIIPEGADIMSTITDAKIEKERQKGLYEEGITGLELREESAEKARKLGKAELRKQRVATQAGVIPTYEQAEARKSATGMEYSAPAERMGRKEMAEIESQMGDYSTKDIIGKEKYEQELADIETERYGVEGLEATWQGAQDAYADSLSAAYEAADAGIEEIETKMHDIYGAYSAGLGQPGLKDLGMGFYDKGKGDISEYGQAKGTADLATDFAEKLRQLGEGSMQDLGDV